MSGVSGPTSRAGRRYAVRLTVAMAAYALVLVAATAGVNALPAGDPWRYVVMATPLVPTAFVAWAVLRLLRETDELQRRIGLEALAAAFALGSLITFGYGLMQVAGAPAVSWLFVWPVYGACWLVTALVSRRRY